MTAAHLVVMTIIDQPRQKAGIPIGGRFANRYRSDASIELGANYPNLVTPNAEQMDRAVTEAKRQIACGQASDIDPVGLAGNIATRLAEQEAAYEAYKRGEDHPDDLYFDAIWDGKTPGFSENMAKAELSYAQEVYTKLDAGIIRPQDVLGHYEKNPTKARAQQWLDDRIELYTQALDCRGKNLSINQARVMATKTTPENTPPF